MEPGSLIVGVAADVKGWRGFKLVRIRERNKWEVLTVTPELQSPVEQGEIPSDALSSGVSQGVMFGELQLRVIWMS